MIKIKHVPQRSCEYIVDDYDNVLFEINYKGCNIDFIVVDNEYEYHLLTADEKDTILIYLFGIKARYGYKYNPYLVYDSLSIHQSYYTY